MTGQPEDNDAALVHAARAGDRAAFAAIYDRYGDQIFDLCVSVLRDRTDAADAAQETFLLAAQRLGQLREPSKLRGWLFAIGRHEALRIARARSRVRPVPELADVPTADADPTGPAETADVQQLVWEVADGLDARDRTVLDLHLRKGLEGRALAETLGVRENHAWVIVHRTRQRFERSLGALLVARRGRADCAALAEVLRGWDGRFSPRLRKRVARHVDDCPTCTETRARVASPAALLAQAPLAAAPLALRDRVLAACADLDLAGSPGRATAPPRGWRDGYPPPLDRGQGPRSGARRTAGTLAAALAVALLLGGAYALDGGERLLPWSGSATVDTPTTATPDPPHPPPSAAGTTPSPSVRPAPTPRRPVSPSPSSRRPATPTAGASAPATEPPAPTSAVEPPTRIDTIAAQPTAIREENGTCRERSETAVVTVTVTGPRPPATVVLHWSVGDVTREAAMTAVGGDTYTRQVPPVPYGTLPSFETAPVTLRVAAHTADGTVVSRTAGEDTLTLHSCPLI